MPLKLSKSCMQRATPKKPNTGFILFWNRLPGIYPCSHILLCSTKFKTLLVIVEVFFISNSFSKQDVKERIICMYKY